MDEQNEKKPKPDPALIWRDIEQQAKECRKTWGMGFPVISLELLKHHWFKATGHLPKT